MQKKAKEQPFQAPPPRRREWWGWTGFGKKTLWDWLQLLVVPAMLALVGFVLVTAQENIQQQAEERRAQAQLDAEEQRAQDQALQAYLEEMGSLLLDSDLRSSEEDDEVRTLAEARTITVLSRVDGTRKRNVMLFLYQSKLIQKKQPLVSLVEADLSGAVLGGTVLSDADLRGANLSGAVLGRADLRLTDLNIAT